MVLHDWQRGKIPFFVPPPQQEKELSEEPASYGVEREAAVDSDKASAAFRAITNVITSQQQKSVPVQRDLFTEDELKGESADHGSTEDAVIEGIPASESEDDDVRPSREEDVE